MMQQLCKFILKTAGWSWSVSVPDYSKSVICIAPHTSNWDFIIGKLFYTAVGRNANFLIKKEWFFFPFNYFFGAVGGIPVDRSQKGSLVEHLVQVCREKERFNIGITPEGTRKRNPHWKKGFYYIAYKAEVPIVLACFDYQHKRLMMDKVVVPTGDEENDMKQIKRYFQQNAGPKYPELFATGLEEER